MNQLHDIRAFVEVARTGSFVRAAEVLDQTSSAVSKAIGRLETELGVRLLQRTTRQISLTDEGHSYLRDCERILGELEAASESVALRKGKPHGLLRVQFPPLWGSEGVVSSLPQFLNAYPDIELRMIISDREVDLVEEGIDLSIRVGPVNDVRLVTKLLFEQRSVIVATPGYLQRAGIPATPDDLASHSCIHYLLPGTFRPVDWHFTRDGKTMLRVFQSKLMLNDPVSIREAALTGFGLVQGPDYLFAEALRRGQLQRVLPEWEGQGPPISMVWLQNRYMSQRLRVFIDWLCATIK